jgi:hypothetical protein
MFEAGKKYRWSKGVVWDCIAAHGNIGWLRFGVNNNFHQWDRLWEEVKEPEYVYYIVRYGKVISSHPFPDGRDALAYMERSGKLSDNIVKRELGPPIPVSYQELTEAS